MTQGLPLNLSLSPPPPPPHHHHHPPTAVPNCNSLIESPTDTPVTKNCKNTSNNIDNDRPNDDNDNDVDCFPWQEKPPMLPQAQDLLPNVTNALPSLIESPMDKSTNTTENNNNDPRDDYDDNDDDDNDDSTVIHDNWYYDNVNYDDDDDDDNDSFTLDNNAFDYATGSDGYDWDGGYYDYDDNNDDDYSSSSSDDSYNTNIIIKRLYMK